MRCTSTSSRCSQRTAAFRSDSREFAKKSMRREGVLSRFGNLISLDGQTMGSNGRRTRKPPRAAERRKKKVLLIHGHDKANLSRLADFVRNLFRCPVEV